MARGQAEIRWSVVVFTFVVLALMAFFGQRQLHLDTNILSAMPQQDEALRDARYVFTQTPIMDRIVVDLEWQGKMSDKDQLVSVADRLTEKANASKLFQPIDNSAMAQSFTSLASQLAANLPLLFDRETLENEVLPKLSEQSIQATLQNYLNDLAGLEGIGQAQLFERDPLGLRNLILARLRYLLPDGENQLYKNHLFSADERHVLLSFQPLQSSMDNRYAEKIEGFFAKAKRDLIAAGGGKSKKANDANKKENILNSEGNSSLPVLLTPVGSYRAGLDNERTAKSDTVKAVLLATIGIALLLLLSFPRGPIGLLSLLPALAGTAAALFTLSFFYESVSILAIGFGGAIISITVDHGIAYFLFLDRNKETTGKEASHEVRAVGLIAVLTTIGAFLSLLISDFSVLGEIGLFAALGVGYSFVFVHSVFPLIFRRMPPARRQHGLWLQRLPGKLAEKGGWPLCISMILLGIFAALIMRPEFRADLAAMNTVSAETLQAEEKVRTIWGDLTQRVYILIEAPEITELHRKADRLQQMLQDGVARGAVLPAATLSDIVPGAELAKKNLADWRNFWSDARQRQVREILLKQAEALGFRAETFSAFFEDLRRNDSQPPKLNPSVFSLFGLEKNRQGDGWLLMSSLKPGPNYQADDLYRAVQDQKLGRMLDARYFSNRLGRMLSDTFSHMFVLIGLGVTILVFFFFLDAWLVLLALAPVAFATVCTLATLTLIDHPIDIPGLMLTIVVLGMGIDYSLFFLRAQQRHFDAKSDAVRTIRLSVFLSACSTLIGLGVLALAEHSLLKSIGLTTFLGIGFSVLGTFTLLPPFLSRLYNFQPLIRETLEAGSKTHRRRILARYRHLEPQARLFARFKLKLDPMFSNLNELSREFIPAQARILDVGCGAGLPGLWLLTQRPDIRLTGIDPDAERVRIARRVWGVSENSEDTQNSNDTENGNSSKADETVQVHIASAQQLPEMLHSFDVIMLLDMLHYLDDAEVATLFLNLEKLLQTQGRILLRVTLPGDKRFPWERWLEAGRLKLQRKPSYFRDLDALQTIIEQSDFRIVKQQVSQVGREETWMILERK